PDLDDFPPGATQALDDPLPVCRNDGLRADDRKPLANAHHDVGVIERHAVAVHRTEEDRLVAELTAPFPHDDGVGAWRKAGVSGPLDVIQHHAPRPLEIPSMLLVGSQIDGPRNLEPKASRDRIDDLLPPLPPPALRLHGIEHHGPVLVKAHPIVRKHRIRLRRLGRVLHRTDAHALTLQRGDETVVLLAGDERLLASDRVRRALHLVGVGRLRVVAEARRSDHEDRFGTLAAGDAPAGALWFKRSIAAHGCHSLRSWLPPDPGGMLAPSALPRATATPKGYSMAQATGTLRSADGTVSGKVLILRHSRAVRILHWVNFITLTIMLMSGLQIFNAHPALYWGKTSDFARPALSIGAMEDDK